MSNLSLFRGLVVLYVLTLFVLHWLPFGSIANNSNASIMFSLSGSGGLIQTESATYLALVIAKILIAIGLLFQLSVARHLFLVVTLVALAVFLLWGVRAFPPIHFSLHYVVALLQGAILYALYFSPIRNEFARRVSS